jgi:glycosyltransferase involved in cell wall biosynthesis
MLFMPGFLRKVLYVLDFFPMISETFISNEMIELIRRGLDIKILALSKTNETAINQEVSDWRLLERASYYASSGLVRIALSCALEPRSYRLFWKAARRSHAEARLKDAVRTAYFTNLLRDTDIVHAHFASKAAVKAMEISSIVKKPFTFTAHAYEIFSLHYYSRERLKMIVDGADAVLTPSVFNRKHIAAETGCDQGKIRIVRATIRPDEETPRLVPVDDDGLRILAIGRMVEKKGFEYLIKAMGIVVRKYPKTVLSFIGRGPLVTPLKELSYSLGLERNVVFLGAQSNEKCLERLSKCHLSILPCVVAGDGDLDVCPLSLQEAMALGVPVISTDAGSVPELIEDGKEGLLVKERDEKGLAEAIVRLIEDASLREALGRKGREKIKKEFNIYTQVNRLISIWESLV